MINLDPATARSHLERLLASEQLGKSEAGRKLLTYLFERSLRDDTPKESEIAFDVFGKDASFSGAEDSVVRVGVRTLRHKLMEYYAGDGSAEPFRFSIPKGGYRLTVVRPEAEGPHLTALEPGSTVEPSYSVVKASPAEPSRGRPWKWGAAAALAFLVASVSLNLHFLNVSRTAADPATQRVRESPVWADVVDSARPLTLVLGGLFMFTQTDPKTGRTLTVRDSEINSSEQLRAILAGNPSFAAERGQRYVSMIQKSAAIGMSAVLRLVATPGRRVEVEVRDDLQADEIRHNDIIYVGPIVDLGPISGYYRLRSRYRFDAAGPRLIDLDTHKALNPEGTLAGHRMDYALFAKFPGPSGNHIMIFTSGLRNAGLLENVRALTSTEGLERLTAKLRAKSGAGSADAFEALIAVTGFGPTDLATEIIDVDTLPARRPEQPAQASLPPLTSPNTASNNAGLR